MNDIGRSCRRLFLMLTLGACCLPGFAQTQNVTTNGGVAGTIPEFQTSTDIENSPLKDSSGELVTKNFENVRFADQFPPGASDVGASINAALSACGSNACTIDSRGFTGTLTWASTVTVKVPTNILLPCATMTFTATPVVSVQTSDVHIHTCGNGGAGTTGGAPPGTATQFVASGLASTAAPVIYAIVPAGSSRNNFGDSLVSGFTLDPLYIDMKGLGNRVIDTVSCYHCKIDHPVINNANCGTAPDGAITQEAGLSSDLTNWGGWSASYFMDMEFPIVELATSTSNVTCHPFFLDARYGEISEGVYNSLWANGGLGSVSGGVNGADSVYIETSTTPDNTNSSFDRALFINLKTQNNSANTYAVNMVAPGDILKTGTSGSGNIFEVHFINPLLERLDTTASGTGIGCTGSTSVAGIGAGCGGIIIDNPALDGFNTAIDSANLGAAPRVRANGAFGDGIASDYYAGFQYGSSTKTVLFNETLIPSSNSEQLFTTYYVPAVNNNGKTGTSVFVGPTVDMGDMSTSGGTVTNGYGFDCNGYGSWATNMYCFYQVGPAVNHFEGPIDMRAGTGNALLPNQAKVANLPSSAALGAIFVVTDSTAIRNEGQGCVGGGSATALAFNGSGGWKCF